VKADFRSGIYGRLRGSLDVPKERFVSYPGATLGADGTLVVTWAGYDNLQQAKALASHYLCWVSAWGIISRASFRTRPGRWG
jgi:hypothetical protein